MNKALEEFTRYTNTYLEYGDMIQNKINHTLRVTDNAIFLSKKLNLPEDKIEIIKVIALLHDIGRFEQWKNYHTFYDVDSIDHGNYGYEVLKKDNYIDKYTNDNQDIILNVVKNHNKMELPNDLTEEEILFIKIIKDADMLDILYMRSIYELKVKIEDKPMSKEVWDKVLEHKLIGKNDLITLSDKLGITFGFVFNFNFKESYIILKERKYFDKIIDIYKDITNNDELKNQLEEMRKIINNYIEERILC